MEIVDLPNCNGYNNLHNLDEKVKMNLLWLYPLALALSGIVIWITVATDDTRKDKADDILDRWPHELPVRCGEQLPCGGRYW